KMIRDGQLASPAERQRFRLEAEIVANLDHPHIVPLYEIGDHEGRLFFSMKLVEGGSLVDRIGEFAGQPPEAARIIATVARAVDYAHRRGLLHRDLKPANILLAGQSETRISKSETNSKDQIQNTKQSGGADWESGPSDLGFGADSESRIADLVPMVTDFGLAKVCGQAESSAGLTGSGIAVGTPGYMAPEQAQGPRPALTVAADVYSLGAILYALLTGKPPFHESTLLLTLRAALDKEPAPIRPANPGVERDL